MKKRNNDTRQKTSCANFCNRFLRSLTCGVVVTGALVGRTRGYNGEGNAAPRRRSSIDAGLARPNQLGESLSQLVQAADDAEGVPY